MNKFILAAVGLMLSSPIFAQSKFDIHPTPQSLKVLSDSYVDVAKITSKCDANDIAKFNAITGGVIAKKSLPLYIGTVKEKWAKKYSDKLVHTEDAFYVSISNDEIVVLGYDDKGLSYAISLMNQLVNDKNELPNIEISDYPDIKYRGVVEGFYGEPWSHEDRISLLNFFGKHRLNAYLYGPKDDPYHSSPSWREPYPAEQEAKISELVKVAKENNVDFVWAIHPGGDIKWNNEDRDAVVHKFELMYDLGVRAFAVFFDDIGGDGTDPNRQAELLNYLHDNFIAIKGDCKPLVMCPTQYNKAWSDQRPGTYLDILGDELHKDINIMWTGNTVVADITLEGLEYINGRIDRKAYIWWNFPVSDYVRNHLLLGRAYGIDTEALDMMSGFVSNPMDKAELSKVAIYSVSEYAWNISDFDSEKEWLDGIKEVMPTSAEAYHTFAMHNSDAGVNYHMYRREESVNIVDDVNAYYASGDVSLLAPVKEELARLAAAPAIIREKNDNPNLIEEASAWLNQSELLGESGVVAIELAENISSNSVKANWDKYTTLLQIREEQLTVDKNNNRNPYQPGVLSGSLVVQPLIDSLTSSASKTMLESIGITANSEGVVLPKFITNTAKLSSNSVRQDGITLTASPAHEPVNVAPGEYIGIKSATALFQGNIEINLGKDKLEDIIDLEFSTDNENWTKISPEFRGADIKAKLPTYGATYFRVINNSDTAVELFLRKFVVTSNQLDGSNGNVAMAQDANLESSLTIKEQPAVITNSKAEISSITMFASSDEAININVIAIDYKGGEHNIGNITSKYGEITIPESLRDGVIRSFKLSSSSTVKVYEMIVK